MHQHPGMHALENGANHTREVPKGNSECIGMRWRRKIVRATGHPPKATNAGEDVLPARHRSPPSHHYLRSAARPPLLVDKGAAVLRPHCPFLSQFPSTSLSASASGVQQDLPSLSVRAPPFQVVHSALPLLHSMTFLMLFCNSLRFALLSFDGIRSHSNISNVVIL